LGKNSPRLSGRPGHFNFLVIPVVPVIPGQSNTACILLVLPTVHLIAFKLAETDIGFFHDEGKSVKLKNIYPNGSRPIPTICHTDKKGNKIFLIYKEIQSGAVA
jgi:hypothetical protein